ncbi:hypothetical protein GW17_00025211 [Ensete ventricosum]|nr:hypothetical protein GW17_00025211 [Ensete ventricosum]
MRGSPQETLAFPTLSTRPALLKRGSWTPHESLCEDLADYVGELWGKSGSAGGGAGRGGGGGGGNEEKNDGSSITVVLKVDMHCEGCAKKVIKSVKGVQGANLRFPSITAAESVAKCHPIALIPQAWKG